ncbi:helix-turn-helix transcriptional regulator [Gorillibacterium timonense]|uniref:helix-turn-helix transcriptional regulator n=1 Tax=Gorillibacterium timonense TaxID=1689269 RepID=UPI00071D0460|nr:helix-turn-helix transcriptional regulator [Gorillibacterium timonense]
MESAVSYTPEELAQLLRVSKLTVYDLIKKGELPAYRVGKQMRVDSADLDQYKRKMRMSENADVRFASDRDSRGGERSAVPTPAAAASDTNTIVITGQDHLLDLVARHMEERSSAKRPLRSMMGSLDGLFSLYRGESDLISTHLFDGDSGEYNLPYIRRILVGFPYVVVHLAERTAGLYVTKGNPHGIRNWADLTVPGIRLANREKGSGARVLLEEELRIRHLNAASILGYEREFRSHMSVASQVAAGNADVGVGSERGALSADVDFIPMRQERIDLVMLKKPGNREWINELKALLASPEFKAELGRLGGYDSTSTGKVIGEYGK